MAEKLIAAAGGAGEATAAGEAAMRGFTSGNKMMWRRWFSSALRRSYSHSENSKIQKPSSTLESFRKNRYQKYFFRVN